MRAGTRGLLALLGAAAVYVLDVAPASAQTKGETAPVGSAAAVAPVTSSRSPLPDAIGETDRARAAEVKRAVASDDPFKPSGVWLPPFWFTDAERSFEWLGL